MEHAAKVLWRQESQEIPMPSSMPRRAAYSALIRAYECTDVLAELVAALRGQTLPPEEILIVDSSRDPTVTAAFEALGARVVPYPEGEFNYSRAINVGVAANRSPYTLIISSHNALLEPHVIFRGVEGAWTGECGIVSWAPLWNPEAKPLSYPVTKESFNGRNGLSNIMAMLPTDLLREHPFREEVFAGEDQAWAKAYFQNFHRPILRIETHEVRYLNPNHGPHAWNETKALNELLALGHFVSRRLIGPHVIADRMARAAVAAFRLRFDRALHHAQAAWAMTKAHFVTPQASSRYF
jgi:glycosyltransferase involved in cell wall biosynthesis